MQFSVALVLLIVWAVVSVPIGILTGMCIQKFTSENSGDCD